MTWKMWSGGAVWDWLVLCPNAQVIGCLSAPFCWFQSRFVFPPALKIRTDPVTFALQSYRSSLPLHYSKIHTCKPLCSATQNAVHVYLMSSTHNLTKYFLRDWFQNKAKCQELDSRMRGKDNNLTDAKKEAISKLKIGKQMWNWINLCTTEFRGKLKSKTTVMPNPQRGRMMRFINGKEENFRTKFWEWPENQANKSIQKR